MRRNVNIAIAFSVRKRIIFWLRARKLLSTPQWPRRCEYILASSRHIQGESHLDCRRCCGEELGGDAHPWIPSHPLSCSQPRSSAAPESSIFFSFSFFLFLFPDEVGGNFECERDCGVHIQSEKTLIPMPHLNALRMEFVCVCVCAGEPNGARRSRLEGAFQFRIGGNRREQLSGKIIPAVWKRNGISRDSLLFALGLSLCLSVCPSL